MTKQEMLTYAKPLILLDEQLELLLRGAVTRLRVPLYGLDVDGKCTLLPMGDKVNWTVNMKVMDTVRQYSRTVDLPYCLGEYIYIQEQWSHRGGGEYWYRVGFDVNKTGYDANSVIVPKQWNTAKSMPKDAARVILQVIGIKIEHLQDIDTHDYQTPINIGKEGVLYACCNCNHRNGECYDFIEENTCKLMKQYIKQWNGRFSPKERTFYGWQKNPWVEVVEFKRVV